MALPIWPITPSRLFVADLHHFASTTNPSFRPPIEIATSVTAETSSEWHYWTSGSRPLLMLDILDYLLYSFNQTTDWNDDNFYSNLTLTSRRAKLQRDQSANRRSARLCNPERTQTTYCIFCR